MEAGPLDAPETRAVLAHELTHVVQHRVYGSHPAARRRAQEGRRLEAEAHAVERFVRGDDPEPRVAPIRTLRATPGDPRIDSGGFLRAVTDQLVARGAAQWDAEGALVVPASARRMTTNGERRPTGPAERSVSRRAPARPTGHERLSRVAAVEPAPASDRGENDSSSQVRARLAAQTPVRQAVLLPRTLGRRWRTSVREGATPTAATDSHEFDRHLQYVHRARAVRTKSRDRPGVGRPRHGARHDDGQSAIVTTARRR